MQENVTFDLITFLLSISFSVVLPLLIVFVPLTIAKLCWFKANIVPLPSWFAAFGTSLLLASFTSEIWILRDESKFAKEVAEKNPKAPYSRSRGWPNESGSLVFVPGKGIHSTD